MSSVLQALLLLLYVLVLQDGVDAFASTPSLTLHRHVVRPSNGAYAEFSVRRDLTTDDSPNSKSPYLLFPGGGLFFYWQAGVVTYLREQGYNLNEVRVGGASAGALTATLTAANVDFYDATELALRLAAKAGVWDRANGLQGIWGPLIETWLHTLLPDDVVETVNGKLCLLVTEIPGMKKKRVDSFQSKHDLIDCNMASVHLPWFLDGKLTASFRNSPHIDGSFLSKLSDFGVASKDHIIMPSFHRDPSMANLSIFDFIKTASPDRIFHLLERGKSYAKEMEECGEFYCIPKV